jgi:hypothetical protein
MKDQLEFLKIITSVIAPILAMIFAIINTLTENTREVVSKTDNKVVKKYTVWAKVSVIGLLLSALLTLFTTKIDDELALIHKQEQDTKDSIGRQKMEDINAKSQRIYQEALRLSGNLNNSLALTKNILIKSEKIDRNSNRLLNPLFPLKISFYLIFYKRQMTPSQRELIAEVTAYKSRTENVAETYHSIYQYETGFTAHDDPATISFDRKLLESFVPAPTIFFLSKTTAAKQISLSINNDRKSPKSFVGSLYLDRQDASVSINIGTQSTDEPAVIMDVTYTIKDAMPELKSLHDISNGMMLLYLDKNCYFGNMQFHCGANFTTTYGFSADEKYHYKDDRMRRNVKVMYKESSFSGVSYDSTGTYASASALDKVSKYDCYAIPVTF